MIKIRNGVFETNSSSTHSITICDESVYQGFIKGEYLYNRYKEEFQKVDLTKKIKDPDNIRAAKDLYKSTFKPYYTPWEKLAPDVKEALIKDYVMSISRDDFEDLLTFEQFQSYVDSRGFSTIDDSFVTEHGDTVHVMGYYGYDG